MATPTPRPQAIDLGNLAEILDLLRRIQPFIEFLRTLFNHKNPPPPILIPPAGPVDPGLPGGPTIPQVPIDTKPSKTIARVALICAGVEVPERVGGGPGINYVDHQKMIRDGQAFNYGCASFWYGQARDENDDEFLGPDIINADLEFRTEYRIYKDNRVCAIMKGEGDNNPTAEGDPAPWHQSESEGVGFGSSRWLNSAGFDNRIVFRGQGDFLVEVVIGGVASNRVPFRVS
jgi:hypothetical protein